jgi:hypothetical protein
MRREKKERLRYNFQTQNATSIVQFLFRLAVRQRRLEILNFFDARVLFIPKLQNNGLRLLNWDNCKYCGFRDAQYFRDH